MSPPDQAIHQFHKGVSRAAVRLGAGGNVATVSHAYAVPGPIATHAAQEIDEREEGLRTKAKATCLTASSPNALRINTV